MSQLSLEVIRQRLLRLSELDLLPPWVKQASAETALSLDKNLPRQMYADPESLEYPCHTKAATATSYGLFLFDAATLPVKQAAAIEANFQTLARHFGVVNTIRTLRQGFDSAQKQAASSEPNENYAVVQVHSDGQVERKYPLRNAKEVRAAAHWLHENRAAFGWKDRQVIATKIAEKADQYGASLGDQELFIEKSACRGWCSPKAAAEVVNSRLPFVQSEDVAARLEQLGKQVAANGQFCADSDELSKLATLLDSIDQANELTHLYDSFVKPPEALFQITYKEASELVDTTCVLTTGTAYAAKQFEKLAYQDVASVFGAEFADQVSEGLHVDGTKFAEVAQTLPLPDARLLERLMAQQQQTPLMKDASVGRIHPTTQDLAQLAAVST